MPELGCERLAQPGIRRRIPTPIVAILSRRRFPRPSSAPVSVASVRAEALHGSIRLIISSGFHLSHRRRYPKLSIRGPVTLLIVIIVLMLSFGVLWNMALVQDYQKLRALTEEEPFHWLLIFLGSLLFLTIIILSSILSAQLIGQIRWGQRQSNFIASVSHELNSPLSSIKLFAHTLRKADLSEADRLNFVGKILDDVERLHRLIANILRAAEMDFHGEELQVVPRRVELRAYLEEFVERATHVFMDAKLTLELVAPEPAWVRLDEQMFRQVLDNLLDNAIRYRSDKDPHVTLHMLHLEPSPVPGSTRQVEIRVIDQGIGIPESELPNLFDRFYRIEQIDARRKRKGTGIGLYVVRSIVQAHNGRVGARSRGPEQGATLWIHLPLASAPKAEKSEIDEDASEGISADHSGASHKPTATGKAMGEMS